MAEIGRLLFTGRYYSACLLPENDVMNKNWEQHKDILQQAHAQRMKVLDKDQLRDIALNDADPHKRVAAIDELTQRLKA